MKKSSTRPVVLVFGEAADKTLAILFPFHELKNLLVEGNLKGFQFLNGDSTTYSSKGKVCSIQYRVPTILIPRIQKALEPFMDVRWQREVSDMDNPPSTETT